MAKKWKFIGDFVIVSCWSKQTFRGTMAIHYILRSTSTSSPQSLTHKGGGGGGFVITLNRMRRRSGSGKECRGAWVVGKMRFEISIKSLDNIFIGLGKHGEGTMNECRC